MICRTCLLCASDLIFLLCMLLSWFVGLYLAQAQDLRHKDKKAIMEVLEKQVEAWNRQDIEGFMEAYWKSDSLKFIGRNGLTKGWQAALDRYKKNYPDKNAMGVLKFEILNIQGICSHAAVVTGKWILTRSVGNLQGFFSLIFEYIDKKWVIVYDHSI